MGGLKHLILMLLVPQLAFGGVLFQAPTARDLDYRAALKADAGWSSVIEWQMRRLPLPANRDTLISRFTAAQEAFVSSSKSQAQKAFLSLVDLRNLDDWKKSDREIFVLAYLRLAQLEPAGSEQDRWLLHSLNIGPAILPDSKLFPPPLLQRRLLLSQTAQRSQWPSLPEGWNALLVNGTFCDEDCPPLYNVEGKVRLTYLSNRWLPYTVEAVPNQYPPVLPKIAWVNGSCGGTRYHAEVSRAESYKAFWSEDCSLLPARAVITQNSPAAAQPAAEFQGLLAAPLPPKRESVLRNKWFWIAVGGVALAALALSNNQEKRDDRQIPTTTYGY